MKLAKAGLVIGGAALVHAIFCASLAQAQKPAAPPAGEPKTNPADALRYVRIPAGSFQMGCSPSFPGCLANENPPHPVSLTKDFWMGQTEVTVGAYKKFAQATGRAMPPEPSFAQGDDYPVVNVSWEDASQYCEWDGNGRLPTEAEWEYAARAGSTAPVPGELNDIAWYFDGESGHWAHPVAKKAANAWGLYDMLGNVWEWCRDWYDKDYYQKREERDPHGPATGTERVVRGAAWYAFGKYVRVSVRYSFAPGSLSDDVVGFRCVRESAPAQSHAQAGQQEEAKSPSKPAAPPAGGPQANPAAAPRYVRITAGNFQMGCSPSETACYGNAKPAHSVSLSKDFWMGQTEVTVGAYRRFAQATGRAMPQRPSTPQGEDHPVVYVSWEDASQYCKWDGDGRLPTEAEWEYAARAGGAVARGDLDKIAWYGGNSRGATHPAAQKAANGWGLSDMLGNAWEWCSDWYDANYYEKREELDAQGPATGTVRVVRGGSWALDERYARVSFRNGIAPAGRYISVGFRCVREVVP